MGARRPVQVGDVLAGRYHVERVLGVGGMGMVVAARHADLHELRAVKVMLNDVARNPHAVERFLREARAVVKLRSEHVAKVHDVGRLEDGSPYIVMECLEGSDFKQMLAARGRLPLIEVADLMIQVCEAIDEAHTAGIVHRDLKPANLFLTRGPGGRPSARVLDFGISKVRDHKGLGVTGTTDFLGSPSYMSPEQISSAKDVDPRSDIWSLGVLLHELSTGQKPFGGDGATDTIGSVMVSDPDPPSSVVPELPPAFDALVARCLRKEPNQRFQNVGELAARLAAFAPQRSRWRPTGTIFDPPSNTATSAPAVSSPSTTSSTAASSKPSTGRIAFVLLPLALLVGGVAAVLVGRGTGAKTPPAVQAPAAAPSQAAPAAPTSNTDEETAPSASAEAEAPPTAEPRDAPAKPAAAPAKKPAGAGKSPDKNNPAPVKRTKAEADPFGDGRR